MLSVIYFVVTLVIIPGIVGTVICIKKMQIESDRFRGTDNHPDSKINIHDPANASLRHWRTLGGFMFALLLLSFATFRGPRYNPNGPSMMDKYPELIVVFCIIILISFLVFAFIYKKESALQKTNNPAPVKINGAVRFILGGVGLVLSVMTFAILASTGLHNGSASSCWVGTPFFYSFVPALGMRPDIKSL